jgi:hypothetical protein
MGFQGAKYSQKKRRAVVRQGGTALRQKPKDFDNGEIALAWKT